ncbi:MAG: radical SAM protein, partial [Elusimicrobia bacterium]|nr:radical SAM protein [Elusimicrobiota bacterium]
LGAQSPAGRALAGCTRLSFTLFRREAFSLLGGFDASYRRVCHDVDFLFRAAEKLGTEAFAWLDEDLGTQRMHPGQLSRQKNQATLLDLARLGLKHPPALQERVSGALCAMKPASPRPTPRRRAAPKRAKTSVLLVDLSDPLYSSLTGRCLRNWAYRDEDLRRRFAIDAAEFSHQDPEDAILSGILRRRPAIVGISCYVWNIGKIRALVAGLKKSLPDVKIILGGPEVMHEPRKALLKIPGADWVACAEEGEEVFRLFLRGHLIEGRPAAGIPGLAWRDGRGGVRVNPPPPFIDLESAPPVYAGGDPVGPSRTVAVLELSRGCPFTCKYCDWGDRKMRHISLPKIEAEFAALARQVERVSLADADILMNRKKGLDILRAFVQATEGAKCRLVFNTNPTFLSPEIIDVISKHPSKFHIGMGVQSTNLGVLKRIDRPLHLERVEANLVELRKRAPQAVCRIQLIVGLPGDDYQGLRRSLDWALRVWPEGVLAFPLLVVPGSALHREAKQQGLRYSPLPMYQIEETSEMGREDMARALELAAYIRFMSLPYYRDAVLGGAEKPLQAIARLERWIEFLKKSGCPPTDEESARDPMLAMEKFQRNKPLAAMASFLTTKFAAELRQTADC